VQCWRDAQKQALTENQDRIYTDGCLHPLQKAFEGHAVIIGAVVGAIIVPVCLSVTFSNILAKQVERQRYLLDKESRRDERRRRRARQRFRDPFATVFAPPERRSREHQYTTVDETGAEQQILPPTTSPSGLPPRKDSGGKHGSREPRELKADRLHNDVLAGTLPGNEREKRKRKRPKTRTHSWKHLRRSTSPGRLVTCECRAKYLPPPDSENNTFTTCRLFCGEERSIRNS